MDETDARSAGNEDPRVSDTHYRNAIESSMDGFWMVDAAGCLRDVNEAYCRISGYRREELLGLSVADLEARESPEEVARHHAAVMQTGHDRFETLHRRKDGSTWRVEVNANQCRTGEGSIYVFLRDIEARTRADALSRARLRLSDADLHDSDDQLLQIALDTAEEFTGSQIGFFHFVDPDQENLTLQNWSTHTLAKMCTAEGHGLHYPISEAGVWTDCIRERRPVIHNDYPGLPHKRGMPEGHAPVLRELTVPILRDGLIVAVIGVGNKPVKYENGDVALVQELGELTMEFIERRRAAAALRRTEETLRLAQTVAHIGSWSLDLASGRLEWSEEVFRIFGMSPGMPLDYAAFLACLPDEAERAKVDAAWQLALQGRPYQVEHRLRTPAGDIKWVEERAKLAFAPDGQPLSAIGTVQDITRRKRAEEDAAQLAHYDPLTSLANRTLFGLRLRQAVQRAGRRNRRCGLMMIDLDFFKRVNDGYGHDVGDQLLLSVAEQLKTRVRSEDMLARLGGDEFAILIDEFADPGDLAVVARDVIEALAIPVVLADVGEFPIGASIGITVFPDDGRDASTLLRNADAAVYQAKAKGRSTFHYYTEALTRAAQERLQLETRLRRGILGGELVLHYQPLLDATRRIVGCEALVRWNDPQAGLIPPGRFIPVAEDSGLIAPLGEWVLHAACRQMKAWLDAGRALRTMAVNLSVRQFELQDVAAVTAKALAAAGLEARYLELEITESTLMGQGEAVMDVLARLRALGVRLSIDDFGTGYSSLSYLKKMPLEKLKIDQSFVRDIHRDPNDEAITRTIIAMARALNLAVLAEGVETAAQFDFLREHGCDYYQGYLFSRPVPAADFPTAIA